MRVPFENNLNCVQTSDRKTDATRLFSAQCYCGCDMLFIPLYSWSQCVFRSFNNVPCEHFQVCDPAATVRTSLQQLALPRWSTAS